MKISVIIPFRNVNSRVIECIKSVKNQNYKNIEIITVSDRAKIRDDNIISLVNARCKGVGEKRNLGVKKSTGDILFFLDSDCVLKKNMITKLVKMFKELGVDAISCKPTAPKDTNLLDFVTGLEYEDRFNQMGESYVNVAATTCLGIIKKSFNKTGGFRDYSRKEATGEDWDFSLKFKKRGFKIFHTNKIEVLHNHISKSLTDYLRRQYLHSRYRITHTRKYKRIVDEYSSPNMIISSMIFLSLPTVIRMYRETRNAKIFFLPFISFLRNFAWFIGTIDGILFD